jgi:hypothetical protein
MARLINKFDDLNQEKNTKLVILRAVLITLFGFLAVSIILGIGVFFLAHG